MRQIRTILCAGVVTLAASSASTPHAQIATRRAASPGALLAYPGFYQGQPVVVRGNLVTRDEPVLLSPAVERAIPLVFKGRIPIDGPVELRAIFWDVGRLQRDDPRLATLGLDRLLPRDVDAEWPRPGEVIALAVTDAMAVQDGEGAPSLRQIALEPSAHVGQRVKIAGQFRGRNLFGDVPQGPGISRWDFVLRSADAAVWVVGRRPRGRGFNLDVGARVDTGTWLEATGVVKEGKGLVWIEAQQIALTKPTLEMKNAEVPAIPQMGPPPEVIFSDPSEGELDVPLQAPVRLQFSRDINPDTFKGNVRWTFAAVDAVGVGPNGSREPERQADFKYDRAKRALEIDLEMDASASYRQVVVELLDGIAATDGARLEPWQLTFSVGAQ